tara:strand:+ start:283 stop:507 length:225 start_codon:yes stop_codon:yes gene_type:complete
MKKLILKGLGKAKVRRIIKAFMVQCFNENIEYNGIETDFTFPMYQNIDGYGLPDLGCDNDFSVGELMEFVDNKI